MTRKTSSASTRTSAQREGKDEKGAREEHLTALTLDVAELTRSREARRCTASKRGTTRMLWLTLNTILSDTTSHITTWRNYQPGDLTDSAGSGQLDKEVPHLQDFRCRVRTGERVLGRPSEGQSTGYKSKKNPAFAGKQSGRPDLNRGPHRPE